MKIETRHVIVIKTTVRKGKNIDHTFPPSANEGTTNLRSQWMAGCKCSGWKLKSKSHEQSVKTKLGKMGNGEGGRREREEERERERTLFVEA